MSSNTRRGQGTPKRSEPRMSAYKDLAVSYEGQSQEIPVRAPDPSSRGIFVNMSRALPEGAILRVQFRLTRSNVLIKARAEVRYCLPGVGVGVEFVDISAKDQRAIEEEMSANFSMP